jgi:hypothetical protein
LRGARTQSRCRWGRVSPRKSSPETVARPYLRDIPRRRRVGMPWWCRAETPWVRGRKLLTDILYIIIIFIQDCNSPALTAFVRYGPPFPTIIPNCNLQAFEYFCSHISEGHRSQGTNRQPDRWAEKAKSKSQREYIWHEWKQPAIVVGKYLQCRRDIFTCYSIYTYLDHRRH